MSLRNIHFSIKEILEEALSKKDYRKIKAILEKAFSPSSFEEIDGIFYKEIRDLIKNRENLENVLLSTKIVFENNDELIEFFELLLKYGFQEIAISYFEELLKDIDDIELINGFNLLLEK